MQAVTTIPDSKRYAKCVEVSKRVRWEIERDVIRSREFDFTKKFLPDGLSKVGALAIRSPLPSSACCRRSRAARTPTCSASSSGSSARRSSR